MVLAVNCRRPRALVNQWRTVRLGNWSASSSSSSRNRLFSGVLLELISTTSASGLRGISVRIIDMTGVMPLPAVSMSSERGCSGSTKSPWGGARNRTSPGLVSRTRTWDTAPASLTVIAGSWPAALLSE
jgi:hypothetical protein